MGVIQSELLCDIWLARVGGRDASLRTAVNFSPPTRPTKRSSVRLPVSSCVPSGIAHRACLLSASSLRSVLRTAHLVLCVPRVACPTACRAPLLGAPCGLKPEVPLGRMRAFLDHRSPCQSACGRAPNPTVRRCRLSSPPSQKEMLEFGP